MSAHSTFDELRPRLPLPLAKLSQRVVNAATPIERHNAAVYLWEASLKLLASVALVEYAALNQSRPQLQETLQCLSRPALGHWWRILRELTHVLSEEGSPQFQRIEQFVLQQKHRDLPLAAGLEATLRERDGGGSGFRQVQATVSLQSLFDGLVKYRNDEIGHGANAMRGSEYYDRVARILAGGIGSVLERLDVLAGCRLIHISDVRQLKSGAWLVERKELMGVEPRVVEALEIVESQTNRLPRTDRLYLYPPGVSLADRRGLAPDRLLHPLLVFDSDQGDVCFLNAQRGKSHAEFLGYSVGLRAQESLIVDQCELMERLLGRTVEQGQVDNWAMQARDDELALGDSSTQAAASREDTRCIGEFELRSVIGQGGMGKVYRAWQPSLGREVALKRLMGGGDPKAQRRFLDEVGALGRVRHPHVVEVYQYGVDGDDIFYTMELLPGADLARVQRHLIECATKHVADGHSRLQVDETSWNHALTSAISEARTEEQARRLSVGDSSDARGVAVEPAPASVRELAESLASIRGSYAYVVTVVQLCKQIADGLEALHAAGVIHRDVKPGNIVVTSAGRAVLTDLSLAKLEAESRGGMSTKGFVGTARYASPEQALSAHHVDYRTDIYSLGVTLWELLTLQPFMGITETMPLPEALGRIQRREPDHVRKYAPHVPKDLDALVMKCIDRDESRRYPTARELSQEFDRWLRGESLLVRPASLGFQLRRKLRREWKQVAVATLGLALVVAAGIAIVIGQVAMRLKAANLLAKQKTEEAETQRIAAEQAGDEARSAARDGARRAAELSLTKASTLSAQGDWAGALLWYADAARWEEPDSPARALHLGLVKNGLDQCPTLRQAWRTDREIRQLFVTPDGRQLQALDSKGGIIYGPLFGDAFQASANDGKSLLAVMNAASGQVALVHDRRVRLMPSPFADGAGELVPAAGGGIRRISLNDLGTLLVMVGDYDSSTDSTTLTIRRSQDGQVRLHRILLKGNIQSAIASNDGEYLLSVVLTDAAQKKIDSGPGGVELAPPDLVAKSSPDGNSPRSGQIWRISDLIQQSSSFGAAARDTFERAGASAGRADRTETSGAGAPPVLAPVQEIPGLAQGALFGPRESHLASGGSQTTLWVLDEDGNDFSTAAILSETTAEVSGQIAPDGDLDYWAFVSPVSGTLFGVVEKQPDSRLDCHLSIYGVNQDNHELLAENDDDYDGTNSRAEFPVTKGQTYFVVVSASASGSGATLHGNYRLRLLPGTADEGSRRTPGSDVATALPIPDDLRQIDGRLMQEGERHFYRFTPAASGEVTVEALSIGADGLEPSLMVINKSQEILGQNDDRPSGGLHSEVSLAVEAGQTYVAIVSATAKRGDYIVRWAPSAGFDNRADETGDELNLVIRLPEQTRAVVGRLSNNKELDSYVLTSPGAGWLSVELNQFESGLDPTLTIYDDSLKVVAQNDDAGSGLNSRIRFEVLKGRTYRAVAGSFGSHTSGEYILRIGRLERDVPPLSLGRSPLLTEHPESPRRWTELKLDVTLASRQVLFRRDGLVLLSLHDRDVPHLWQCPTGDSLGTLPHRSATAAAFSPNGRLIATAGGDGVRLWDATTFHPAFPMLWHDGGATAVEFDSTGRWLVTASEDGAVLVWDLTPVLESVVFQNDSRQPVRIVPDEMGNRFLAQDRAGVLRLTDVHGKDLPRLFAVTQEIERPSQMDALLRFMLDYMSDSAERNSFLRYLGRRTVEFSPQGRAVAVQESDDALAVYDLLTEGSPPPRRIRLPLGPLARIAWSADDLQLAAAFDEQSSTTDASATDLWSWNADGHVQAILRGLPSVNDLAFDSSGQWLVAATAQGVAVWDLTATPPTTVVQLQGPDDVPTMIHRARLTRDRKTLVMDVRLSDFALGSAESPGSSSSDLWTYQLDSGQWRRMKHLQGLQSFLLYDAGAEQRILSWSPDGQVRCWTLQGQVVRQFNHDEPVLGASLGPNNSRVVSWSNQTVRVWEMESGEALSLPVYSPATIERAGLNSDGYVWVSCDASSSGLLTWKLERASADLVKIQPQVEQYSGRAVAVMGAQTQLKPGPRMAVGPQTDDASSNWNRQRFEDCLTAGDWVAAGRCLDQLVLTSAGPNDSDLDFLRIRLDLARSDAARAAEDCTQALARVGSAAESRPLRALRGLAALNAGLISASLADFTYCIEQPEAGLEWHLLAAIAAQKSFDSADAATASELFEFAERELTACIAAQRNDDPSLLRRRAQVRSLRQHWEEAIDDGLAFARGNPSFHSLSMAIPPDHHARLIAALTDEDPYVQLWSAVIMDLSEGDPQAIAAAATALTNRADLRLDALGRQLLVELVARHISSNEMASRLRDLHAELHSELSPAAAVGLLTYGSQLTEPDPAFDDLLLVLCKNKEPRVRLAVVAMMSDMKLGATTDERILGELLFDADDDVKSLAESQLRLSRTAGPALRQAIFWHLNPVAEPASERRLRAVSLIETLAAWDPSAPDLMKAQFSSDIETDLQVRTSMIEAIARALGAQAADFLQQVLSDARLTFDERAAAARALRRDALVLFPPPATLESLTPLLSSADSLTQRRVVDLLGEFGIAAQSFTPALQGLAHASSNPQDVRLAAAIALGQIPPEHPESMPPADDSDPQVRVALAWARYRWAGSSDSIRVLTDALLQEDVALQQRALGALILIGPAAAEAVPDLIGTFVNSDESILEWSADALGKVGPPARFAIPVLLQSLEHDKSEVRRWSVYALGAIGLEAETVVSELLKRLDDSDEKVRIEAATAIGCFGPAAATATDRLKAIASSEADAAHDAAVTALSKINPPAIIEAAQERISAGAEPAHWYLMSGTGRAAMQDWNAALDDFGRALAEQSADPRIAEDVFTVHLAVDDSDASDFYRETAAGEGAFMDRVQLSRWVTLLPERIEDASNLVASLQRVIATSPNDEDLNGAWGLWGAVALRAGKPDEAVRYLRLAIRFHTGRTPMTTRLLEHEFLALALAALGDRSAAGVERQFVETLKTEFDGGSRFQQNWKEHVWVDHLYREVVEKAPPPKPVAGP